MPLLPIDERIAQKRLLRRQYRDLRRTLTEGDRRAWDALLCEHILSLKSFSTASALLAYYPLGDEPNLLPVVQKAWDRNIPVAFPVCEPETATMVFRVVRSPDELRSGSYGIQEPIEACPALTDFDGALCLVPALCFDRNGMRIGYGKGYYDRFLAAHTVTSVGATYSPLVTDSLPCEPTDKAVSILITERGILFTDEK